MELHMPYDETPGLDGGKAEESFEMVAYLTETQKGDLCSLATQKLKGWLLVDHDEDDDTFEEEDNNLVVKKVERSELIDAGDFSFRLSYRKRSREAGADQKNRFPSQFFCSNTEPNRCYFHPKDQFLRCTGFSSLVILESVDNNYSRLPISAIDYHSKPPPKPEITEILIKVAKSILNSLGVKGLPILVPADARFVRQFKGVVLLPTKTEIVVEDNDSEEDGVYRIVLSELPSADLVSLKSIDCIKEYCSDLTRKKFGDFVMESTFNFDTSFSAEYRYALSFTEDINWIQVKSPTSETKSYNIPIKGSLGFKSFEFGMAGLIHTNSVNDCKVSDSYTPPNPAWGSHLDPIKNMEVAAIFTQLKLEPESEMNLLTASEVYIEVFRNRNISEGAILTQILQNAVKFCFDEDYGCMFSFESENQQLASSELFSKPYGKRSHQAIREKEWECESFIEYLFSPKSPSQSAGNFESRLGLGVGLVSSVPYQSLLWQLAYFCVSTASVERRVELRSLLEPLWKRFTAKIRHTWENNGLIPNVNPPASPGSRLEVDLRSSLLHQKLSMINYCSERRQTLIKKPASDSSSSVCAGKPTESYGLAGSPELLSPPASYASARTDPDIRRPQRTARENSLASESFVKLNGPSSADSYTSLVGTPQPPSSLGRLAVLDDCRLLFHDEPLYIPVTQDPGFMTEDMLKEQVLLFEQLGTSDQATQRRAQIQGAHLLSDMEAFKAANPRAALGDFVRWYSPRDWVISSENSQGALSARMGNPDNIWQELWQKAEPIPADRQKQLFNPDTEGEKALHYLEHMTAFELLRLLLPTIFLVACNVLKEALPHSELPQVRSCLQALATQLILHPWNDPDPTLLLENFNKAELFVERAHSLLKKFPGQYRLVSDMADTTHPVAVQAPAERASIQALLDSQIKNPFIATPLESPLIHSEIVFEGNCHHRVYLEIFNAGARISSLHPA